MAQVTNGSMIIPTPKHVNVLNGDFAPIMDLMAHIVDVSRVIHNPKFKSIIGHCVWMMVKQIATEIRTSGNDAEWPMQNEMWQEAEAISNQANPVMDMVLQ